MYQLFKYIILPVTYTVEQLLYYTFIYIEKKYKEFFISYRIKEE